MNITFAYLVWCLEHSNCVFLLLVRTLHLNPSANHVPLVSAPVLTWIHISPCASMGITMETSLFDQTVSLQRQREGLGHLFTPASAL